MAKEEVFGFRSNDLKTQIHAIKWTPESGEYKAILQITHGMIEYIKRYRPFAEFLTQNGYMVVGHDHIGHGESVSNEYELGYFPPEHPSDTLVEDMHELRKMIQGENPGVPYFMLGHSMGSYMLRKYLTIHGEDLNGAIIMGTGTIPDNTLKMGLAVVTGMGKVLGWRHRSRLVEHLSFTKSYKQYDLKGKNLKNSWLTKDKQIVNTYYHDPLCTFRFTLSGYKGLMEAILYDNQQKNIEKVPKDLPLFFVSGDQDPVGDMGAGVKRVYYKFDDAGMKDSTWKLYKDDRHEILNETDREIIFHDILTWMDIRIKG